MYYSNNAKILYFNNEIVKSHNSKNKYRKLRKEFLKVRYIFESIFVTGFFLLLTAIVPFKGSNSLLLIDNLLKFGLFGSLCCICIKNYYFLKGSGIYTILMLIPGVNILLFLLVFAVKYQAKGK